MPLPDDGDPPSRAARQRRRARAWLVPIAALLALVLFSPDYPRQGLALALDRLLTFCGAGWTP